MTYEPPVTDYDYIVENCTCAFCGCNCDDLDYLVKDNHVVAVRHACRLGASKVMEDMDQRLVVPMIRDEDGELMEVDWDTALDKAAEYIANSIRPVFYGWSETSTECMKEGLELGEYIGAVLDNQATICHGPSLHTGIPELAQHLVSHGSALREVEIDYAGPDYSQAESVLTWYNRRLYIKTKDGSKVDMNELVEELVENIRMGLIEKKGNAPHLKVYGLNGEDFVKGSLIGVDYDTEYERKLAEEHENLRIILNARVTCPARPFSRLADDALDDLCDAHDLECQVFFTECFGMSDEGRR